MNFKLTKSSLNFKVYTSPTIPASGTENDIVIISSTPMENWILSSDAPTGEPMNNGDVWIQYSVSGNVFNIMNQHDFMLAITKIYQYVSGTWVSVDARRYVGGVWDVVSSAFSASINITYPATSTCVVTNSSGQTVASDTNTGSSTKTWTATVNATGTYTVTATVADGSDKTASKTVTISADGGVINVELVYELLLFFDGNSYTNVTGGWVSATGAGTANCSVDGAYLVMYAAYASSATGTTGNLIDLTNYSVLEITIAETGAVNDARSYVSVLDSAGHSLAQKNALTQGVHIVDLSEITGDCRIRFGVSSNLTYKISKVRLY